MLESRTKKCVANVYQVRSMVSDYLFIVTESDTVKMVDWTRQPKVMKGEVEALRGVLVV